MKKFILSVFLILILCGCNVNQKDRNVKELEFWTLQLESFRPYLTQIISEYESVHPDIKIKWVDIPFSEGEKRTLASVMSNNVPDIVNLNPDFSATLATRNALVSINDAVVGEKKIEVLLKNECFIQTSRFEGLPTGVLEALSVGLPCLVTDGTNTAEIINEYNAGWGVEGNPKNISETIKSIVQENDMRKKSIAAKKLIDENYTWDMISKKEVAAYHNCLLKATEV